MKKIMKVTGTQFPNLGLLNILANIRTQIFRFFKIDKIYIDENISIHQSSVRKNFHPKHNL